MSRELNREYTPFEENKEINDLEASDLEVLKDIPEGWHIEYKREPCKPKDYAKEVSAFANAYGGWLFIGLEEDSSTGKPLGGSGLDKDDARKLEDSARDAIQQNLSVSPYVEIKIIEGSIESLDIDETKCILVIKVPRSENTPHIHCSGRIYVRQVDKASPFGAEPKEITSRGELNSLYERSEKLREKTLSFLKMGFDEKWIEEFKQPWFHLALIPDPDFPNEAQNLTFENFRQIVLDKQENKNFIELPDVYPSALGYLARNHSQQPFPNGSAATFEYSHWGDFFITIPLPSGVFSLQQKENPSFLSTQIGQEMRYVLSKYRLLDSQITDISFLYWVMGGFYQKILDILSVIEVGEKYIYQVQMVNIFRYIPYFESSSYVNWCKNNTIPIIPRDRFSIPLRADDWNEIDNLKNENYIRLMMYDVMNSLCINDELAHKIICETVNLNS